MSHEQIAIALWLFALGASLFVAITGVVLGYHWVRFAMNSFATLVALAVYALISLILLLTLFGAVAGYSV